MSNLHQLTTPWLGALGTDDIIGLRDHLAWLQGRLFDQYEPNWYETFDDRIALWLGNVPSDDEKQTLFRLLEHLFFIGKAQFDSLSRAAFHDNIARWIIELDSIDLRAADLASLINARVERTWFCPITDSMRINSFLKLNKLRGHDFRPDWRSIVQFGDPSKVSHFIQMAAIEGIVILEDFVGGGKQMSSSIQWMAANLPHIPVLVVPLVCCPEGIKTGKALEKRHSNITFSPVLAIGSSQLLKDVACQGEPPIFAKVRAIINAEQHRFDEWTAQPFGWDDVGSIVALFTNCPDNTLPILFHSGPDWEPLFPRLRRG